MEQAQVWEDHERDGSQPRPRWEIGRGDEG